MTAYSWKAASGIAIDAQAAGGAIEDLRGRVGGHVLPADVLEHARSANSPLHGAFEWDDGEAAHRYRIQQAGHLLRSLVVHVRFEPRAEPKPVRAFVNVVNRETDRRGYVSLPDAMSDADYRAQVIQQAWRELHSWREKYREYSELAAVTSAIEAEQPEQRLA